VLNIDSEGCPPVVLLKSTVIYNNFQRFGGGSCVNHRKSDAPGNPSQIRESRTCENNASLDLYRISGRNALGDKNGVHNLRMIEFQVRAGDMRFSPNNYRRTGLNPASNHIDPLPPGNPQSYAAVPGTAGPAARD